MPKIRFRLSYFCLTILLFSIEVIIAKYVTGWVRDYLGDVLVVMLIYSAVMAVFRLNKRLVILATLLFAFTIECSQYFKLAEILGFERGSLGYIVIGNTFSVEDLICYGVGCLLVWLFERLVAHNGRFARPIRAT